MYLPNSYYTLHTTYYKLKRSFTLIELLIVISIISILVTAGIYSWQGAQVKARDNRRKSDFKAIQQGLETYFAQTGRYPTSSAGSIQCVGGATIAWGSPFTCGSTTYMQKVPGDPTLQGGSSGYYYDNTGYNTYILSAYLENPGDSEVLSGSSGMGCTPFVGRNFCVKNP
jgi:general secretion pathway protein G